MKKRITAIFITGGPATGKSMLRRYINSGHRYGVVAVDDFVEGKTSKRVSFGEALEKHSEEIKSIIYNAIEYYTSHHRPVIVDLPTISNPSLTDVLSKFDPLIYYRIVVSMTDKEENVRHRNSIRSVNNRQYTDAQLGYALQKSLAHSKLYEKLIKVNSGMVDDFDAEYIESLK